VAGKVRANRKFVAMMKCKHDYMNTLIEHLNPAYYRKTARGISARLMSLFVDSVEVAYCNERVSVQG
jgi:hypothetical protein